MRNFYYRLFRFEFWPWWAMFLPLVPVYLFGVLRSRSLLFFTAVNPAIPMGGFFGEEKDDILRRIPDELLPKSRLVRPGDDALAIHSDMEIGWPCMLKPNVGERGYFVRKADVPEDLERYAAHGFPFLIQEYIDLPFEFGVLVHQSADTGEVSSLCQKEYMQVKGDGVSTIRALVAKDPRHRLYLDLLEREHPEVLDQVPAEGQMHVVHGIGNHIKGTRFVNRNDCIDAELNATFVGLLSRIEGFDYGRFDVRAASLEALKRGEFKIFEFNGVSSDPGHIFDLPTVFHAYGSMIWHWNILAKIGRINIKKGVKTTPVAQFLVQVRDHFWA